MYTVTDRISASIDVSLTTAILALTVQVLENSKTWISIIICSESYVMDRSMVGFFKI